MKKQQLIDLVLSLKNQPQVDEDVIKAFLERINSKKPLTKNKSLHDHICSFFVPVYKKEGLIYLGHHIKANDWIPPGGHIEKNELPKDTVLREFNEELKHKLTNEKIILFNLSVKHLEPNPYHKCKVHYDFWHIVYVDKIDFDYLKKEYYDASWFTYKEALKKIKTVQYKEIIKKMKVLI